MVSDPGASGPGVSSPDVPEQAGPAGDESLADTFWSVARRLRETSQATLTPWDITVAHLRAMRVLGKHGPTRPSVLSDHLHIAPRSATEVVDALESRGLVRRRPDPSDRRATLVELSEHGASVMTAIRAARGTEAERTFGRLSPADREHLARILHQILESSPGGQAYRSASETRATREPAAPGRSSAKPAPE